MKTFTTYPEALARFYDVIYQHHRDGVDNAFFLDRMKAVKGPVLEVGVGTGRFFMDALRQGTDIYGLDVNQSMLDILLSKLDRKEHYRISRQHIADYSFDHTFDLIIAPFRVIMHVLEKEEQIMALNNAWAHLAPGGEFIFDTFVPDLGLIRDGLDEVLDFEGEHKPGHALKRIVSSKPDYINQLLDIRFHLEWEEGGETNTFNWDFSMRFFFRYELEHFIERSKFNQYELLGDYQGNPLGPESREFIAVCKKT